MSPKKKKPRTEEPVNFSSVKRSSSPGIVSKKRSKKGLDGSKEDKESLKRKNFVKACKQVSHKAFLNYYERFNLFSIPQCAQYGCNHHDVKNNPTIKSVSAKVEESFKIEMKSNMWYEALDVCFLSITQTQYLSENILKDIVEIILNAHEDTTGTYTISSLLNRCQQILSTNFNTHPPCTVKTIRKCYMNFLQSPMDMKENTFTDRAKFECQKGIVRYCFNRLEAELHAESKDEALIDKTESTPEEMKNSIQGLHWQKEKFEIFEMLNRDERIDRLMTILRSIIELLQIDLAIWHSRYTNNLGSHIMRSSKPFMAYILWSHNILYTGAVTNDTRQILRLFVYFIHLKYPEVHINTMTMWLDAVIQTFYICETNSQHDYPNIGKYSSTFAKEFYKILSEMPNTTILSVLERIKPYFMQYLICKQHLNAILPQNNENDIIQVLTCFIQNTQWQDFPESNCEIEVPKNLITKHIKPNKLLTYLKRKCIKAVEEAKTFKNPKAMYPKMCDITDKGDINQNYVTTFLFIALHGFLKAYSVQNVQETWDSLNKQLDQENLDSESTELSIYSVSEVFVKKYRFIYQMLKELVIVLHKLKNDGQFVKIFKIFASISILGL